jgi:hypothetical protein
MVNPVTQEIPANAPSKITIKIARTRFRTSERRIKKKLEITRDAPNNLLLENCANTFGPKEIPSAKPVNTAPNKTPYAASPACRSPTNVRAKPITAPAAKMHLAFQQLAHE